MGSLSAPQGLNPSAAAGDRESCPVEPTSLRGRSKRVSGRGKGVMGFGGASGAAPETPRRGLTETDEGRGRKPRQLGVPPILAVRWHRGSAGHQERRERLRRRPVRHRPNTRRRLLLDAGAERNWSEPENPPPHTTPARGGTGWNKMCPVLTKDAVFLQGAVDLAVGVDLEVVLGGTVELPAPGRSPEVLVDAAASPRIPARPRVTRGGSGGLGYPRGPARGPRLLQQTQQQDPNYNHCGMMAAALNLLGRWRLGANDTRGPIKAVLLAALQSCRAHTGSSCEALASFYQPRSGPFICLRFT